MTLARLLDTIRLAELLPDGDHGEGEEDGVDDADGRELEPGDLVVLDQSLDADPAVDHGLRAHRDTGRKDDDQRDQEPQRKIGQEIRQASTPLPSALSDLDSLEAARVKPQARRCKRDAEGIKLVMIDKRPQLIARCADVADVFAAVNFGRDNKLPIAIRGGGGHNGPGLGSVDDGLVIDLSTMKGVRVDPKNRTARVGPDCTSGDVDHATQAFGQAIPFGIVSTTGVAGLTLSGGHGYLSRKYGLAIDNLLEADVVLADGSFIIASGTENADLLWALRGGGGNFGVVTSFLFRTHPVAMVYGGPIVFELRIVSRLPRVRSGGARDHSLASRRRRAATNVEDEIDADKEADHLEAGRRPLRQDHEAEDDADECPTITACIQMLERLLLGGVPIERANPAVDRLLIVSHFGLLAPLDRARRRSC